ncbi:unnamed protein product (macronuclear) [Paramecium tetraurelia]|uniref:Uncharacterized protein n=1 Tax=Paramecium tetraurelia TaxID=5888 RepID=A0E543_PARTE|nr:uncharacterized protein GSPATT00023587001 [Paramecium tetraurelia]CAK90410.1 unnamed protein product [Paramecium tetraurelia]|eukprot:XP_001457807.1 hypothetical protein (macronuclear) [Paramecium tetraurelia strain d4-2]
MLIRRAIFRFSKEKINKILDHEEYLTEQIDKMAAAFNPQNNKIFNNYTVFQNKLNVDGFSTKLNRSATIYITVWSMVGGLSYLYINPWVTLIPVFFSIQTISSYIKGRKYLGKLVQSITLEKDQRQCLIELGNKNVLKVNVTDNELLNISDVISVSNNKIEEEVNQKYRQSNYVIQFETKYDNRLYEDLRVLVTKDNAEIPNIKLLQDIITGEDVSGYIYEEIVQNQEEVVRKETDEELEKRLKDELKI